MKTQCVLLFLIIAAIDAFTIQPAATRMAVNHRSMNLAVQFMSQDAQAEAEALREKARQLKEEAAALSGTTVEAMDASETKKEEEVAVAKMNADGTLYDDEVAEYKDPLSDNMRARLMREASTGLDSEQKQTNVLLYICVAVAVLVAAGGGGILY